MTDEVQIKDVLDSQEPLEEVVRQTEKLIPASEVSKHIAGAKKKAYEKARRDLEAEMMDRQPIGTPEVMARQSEADLQSQAPLTGNPQEMMREEIQRVLKEQSDAQLKQHQESEDRRIITELASKMEDAKKRMPDFDDVLSQFDFTATPDLLRMSNMFDNSGDLLYDLAKNPMKIGSLVGLAGTDPRAAHAQMRKLSESIKQNSDAKNQGLPNEPLQSLRSSNVGSGNGTANLADLKRKYRG